MKKRMSQHNATNAGLSRKTEWVRERKRERKTEEERERAREGGEGEQGHMCRKQSES
jgi:hypothetical protein